MDKLHTIEKKADILQAYKFCSHVSFFVGHYGALAWHHRRNKAPAVSWPMALAWFVELIFYTSMMMQHGTDFFCFSSWSMLIQPLYCLCRICAILSYFHILDLTYHYSWRSVPHIPQRNGLYNQPGYQKFGYKDRMTIWLGKNIQWCWYPVSVRRPWRRGASLFILFRGTPPNVSNRKFSPLLWFSTLSLCRLTM